MSCWEKPSLFLPDGYCLELYKNIQLTFFLSSHTLPATLDCGGNTFVSFISSYKICELCEYHLGGVSVLNTKLWALDFISVAMGSIIMQSPASLLSSLPVYSLALAPGDTKEPGANIVW